MKYKEEINAANSYREEYLNSIDSIISSRHEEARKMRAGYFEKMKHNMEEYRCEFVQMLGWPLTEYSFSVPPAKKSLVTEEEDLRVYRVQLLLPIGLKFYGIYFEHRKNAKLPLVITQHGGDGTAELCSGFFEKGTDNYNDMVMRTFNKGVNVFAPQLLIWDGKLHNIPFHRERMDARLKQVNSSITAVEVYALRKCTDYLSSLETVDEERIGMIGLSYGGFYTLFTAAVDTRIKAAVSSCFYNDRQKHSWVDWVWKNSGYRFFDNEIACMVYPRHLSLEVGDKDELFPPEPAKREYERLLEMTDDHSWIDFTVFDGAHEFNKSDENIDKLISILKK